MKTIPVGEFKTNFSSILKQVNEGKSFAVSYGRSHKKVAILSPYTKPKTTKRKLGILEGKATVRFADDFKMTEEEFINLKQ